MTLDAPRCPRYLLAAVALLTSIGCSDRMTTPDETATTLRSLTPNVRFDISDGAHGGNPNVFFLPPLVKKPKKAGGFKDEAFQPGLPVTMDIRDMSATGHPIITQFSASDIDVSEHAYRANWKVKKSNLKEKDTYRIEVLVGSKLVAFADVRVVDGDKDDLKNMDDGTIIRIDDDGTIPIRVRIQFGWDCVNQNSCVAQVVPNPVPPGQTIIVVSNDGLNSAAFTGNWAGTVKSVVITLENVTNQLSKANGGPGCSLGVTTMVSIEHCVRITADPSVILTAPVQVGTCIQNPIGDHRQLLLKYDINETPHFLTDEPPPHPCPAGYSMTTPSSSNPLVRLAAATLGRVGQGLGWAMGLQTAYAFDVGVGGTVGVGDGFSLLTPGFPAEMSIVGGNGQSGAVSSVLPTRATVRISALHDVGQGELPAAVLGEHVTCTAVTKGAGVQSGSGFAASAPAVDKGDGTYTCPAFELSAAPGANTFRVTASNLDPNVILESADGEHTTDPGLVTFTETGAAGAPNIASLKVGSAQVQIDGPTAAYTAEVDNPTTNTYQNVVLNGFVVQGNTRRAAGSFQIVCNDGPSGQLPPEPAGACIITATFQANDVQEPGTGTFATGAATFELDLQQQTPGSPTVLTFDTKTFAITLTPAP